MQGQQGGSFRSAASTVDQELAKPPGRQGSHQTSADDEEGDDVIEHDPSGRFSRYLRLVGSGRFKHVFKGFDEKRGTDVAWSKISRADGSLEAEQMRRIVAEMSIGLDLEHPHVIRCHKCWADPEQHCVNLITEFFTSGNLRDYRQRHKHLEPRAVRKWARQVLLGINYLHSKAPPIIHGDLRCDKIYINGHSGDVKIGDLGLATLLPRRFPLEALPDGVNKENQYTKNVDIFAYGLCVLELATLRKLESSNCQIWPELLHTIQDEEAASFIMRCLEPAGSRPTAAELLEDPFLHRKLGKAESSKKIFDAESLLGRTASNAGELASTARRASGDNEDRGVTCAVGSVRGEDYNFQFSGRIKQGKLSFRLNMRYEGSGDESPGRQVLAGGAPKRTIDFTYDPDVDSPEEIAEEIGNEFSLSSTDRDICAAALKEWLAKEMPGSS